MGNMNDNKTSKTVRRKKAVRIIQAIIILLIVLGMIISGIMYSFGD